MREFGAWLQTTEVVGAALQEFSTEKSRGHACQAWRLVKAVHIFNKQSTAHRRIRLFSPMFLGFSKRKRYSELTGVYTKLDHRLFASH